MGYTDSIRYVEEIGFSIDGGIRKPHAGGIYYNRNILIDRYAFDAKWLAGQLMEGGNYRTVLAHEIGHWHIDVHGWTPAHEEFMASSLGAYLPSISPAERSVLKNHALLRWPN